MATGIGASIPGSAVSLEFFGSQSVLSVLVGQTIWARTLCGDPPINRTLANGGGSSKIVATLIEPSGQTPVITVIRVPKVVSLQLWFLNWNSSNRPSQQGFLNNGSNGILRIRSRLGDKNPDTDLSNETVPTIVTTPSAGKSSWIFL